MITRTDKISDIITVRKKKAEEITALQQWVWNASTALAAFRESITTVDMRAASEESVSELTSRSSAIESELRSHSVSLEKVRSHFAKDTLSVAVVGQAGMGKSTFLQSLTGLSDSQIPASGGRACTSTQSRIDNLAIGPGYAEVFYYSRNEVIGILEECYSLLKWSVPSFRSLDDFVRDFDSREKPAETALESLWRLLKTYRDNARALEDKIFAPNLQSKRIPLEEVAYSVTYSEGESRPENLGIARVEIHCKFPCEDVGRLSVVDTPGMNAASEDRDKIILEKVLDETADFVLFVGIPAERGVSQKEREMFDNCRRCARQVSDIKLDRKAFYVANQAMVRDNRTGEIRRNGADPEYNKLWKDDFDKGVIPAAKLLAVDVKDAEAVRSVVLDPMIDYLVATLPELDDAEVKAAKKLLDGIGNKIKTFLDDIDKKLGFLRTTDPSDYRRFRGEFEKLLPNLSSHLSETLNNMMPSRDMDIAAHIGAESNAPQGNVFTETLKKIVKDYRSGTPAFLSIDAVKNEMFNNPGQGGAAFFNLMSHLRCYIIGLFAAMDDNCQQIVEDAKAKLEKVFRDSDAGCMGGIKELEDKHGSEFFEALARFAKTVNAPILTEQLDAYARFRLSFSGFMAHKVSAKLDSVRNCGYMKIVDKINFSSAEEIQESLIELGLHAINDVAIELSQSLSSEPNEAVFAMSENFVDITLRTRTVKEDWSNLYEALKGDVWPELFNPNNSVNRSMLQLRENLSGLKSLVDSLKKLVA